MLPKLIKLRREHLLNVHDVVFYPYQEVISDSILAALIQNLRVTSSATEGEIKKLQKIEIPIEISRQAGKTTAVVLTIDFIMVYLSKLFNRRITTGIFAPQREQAKTDFDRLKEALFRSEPLFATSEEQKKEFKEQSNATTLILPNGSSCYIFPVTSTSHPESKTLDLIVFEESQSMDDKIVKEQIWPMGANTNAPRVYVGTAGTQICYFYRLGQSNEGVKLYYDEIISQRRDTYAQTKDATHLIYEQAVQQEITKYGRDSDEIARPYFGKWLIGTGQFTTQEELDKLYTDRQFTYQFTKSDCFAGIDTAKHPDSTVVTIIRGPSDFNLNKDKKEILNWMELRGENYQDQFDIIVDFLKNYNVVAVAIDSTAQGDFMPDLFEKHTQWQDEHSGLYRIKFSAVSKDLIYKNLKVSIQELLTTLPKIDKRSGARFRQQMLDLQQAYKGQLLSVNHPNSPDARDDYCFVAGTPIKTEEGDIPIEKLQIGQKVWTRMGFKSITRIGNRKAGVITRFGITGTPDHPFITSESVVRFDEVDESAKIYIWNEKLSNIEARSIIAIQSRQKDSSEFIIGDTTRGKSHLNRYIDKFISTTMELYRKVGSYITKTRTLSTTTPRTWKRKVGHNISQNTRLWKRDYNQLAIYPVTLDHWLPSGTLRQRAEHGTENTPKKVSSNEKTDQETTRADSYQTVYNLTIAEQPEYLADGILVHNCDSWALAEWAYAKWNENTVTVDVVEVTNEPKRQVERDHTGKVSDYWPGLEGGAV